MSNYFAYLPVALLGLGTFGLTAQEIDNVVLQANIQIYAIEDEMMDIVELGKEQEKLIIKRRADFILATNKLDRALEDKMATKIRWHELDGRRKSFSETIQKHQKAQEDKELIAKGGFIMATTYNPEVGQTDASPCIGASLADQCDLARNHGARIMALSQDLVSRSSATPYHYHDKVLLKQDPREAPNALCEGEYEVLDTMNARFTNRADIFLLDRSKNTRCNVSITKL